MRRTTALTDTHTDVDNGLSGGPSFGCKCGLAVVDGDGDGDGGGGGDKPGGGGLLAMPLGSGGMTGGGGLGLYRLTGSGGAIFGIAGMPAMSVSSSIIFPHHDPSKVLSSSSSSSPPPLSWSWPWSSPLAS